MTHTYNKMILVGNLGKEPTYHKVKDDKEIASFSIATNISPKEKPMWHRIVVFNDVLVKVCKDHLTKGCTVFIEGALNCRSWKDKVTGEEKSVTEVLLSDFNSSLVVMSNKANGNQSHT